MPFESVRQVRPLIHLMTNSVTIESVVDITLASGATAICAQDPEESAEITALCAGLLINIGTPTNSRIEAFIKSGKVALSKNIPIVLDIAGLGSSAMRGRIVDTLLEEISFDIIRGNGSEIAALCGIKNGKFKGVEDGGIRAGEEEIRRFLIKTGSIIVMTGRNDVIYSIDEGKLNKEQINNKDYELPAITGNGDMFSALLCAGAASCATDNLIDCIRKIITDYHDASEIAYNRMRNTPGAGNSSYKSFLIDAVSVGAGDKQIGDNT